MINCDVSVDPCIVEYRIVEPWIVEPSIVILWMVEPWMVDVFVRKLLNVLVAIIYGVVIAITVSEDAIAIVFVEILEPVILE